MPTPSQEAPAQPTLTETLWDVEADRTREVGNVLTSPNNLQTILGALQAAMWHEWNRARSDGGLNAISDTTLGLLVLRDQVAAIAPDTAARLNFEKADEHLAIGYGPDAKAADVIAQREAKKSSATQA